MPKSINYECGIARQNENACVCSRKELKGTTRTVFENGKVTVPKNPKQKKDCPFLTGKRVKAKG